MNHEDPKEETMATLTEELSLYKIARRVAAEHDDIEAAIDALLAEVGPIPPDTPEEIVTLIRSGARTLLHTVRHHWRLHVKAGPAQPCQRNTAEAFSAVGQAASLALLEMQVGNKRLGNMTGEELREASIRHGAQAKGLQRSSCFLGRVADKTPAKGLARKAWTERRLRKLWESLA